MEKKDKQPKQDVPSILSGQDIRSMAENIARKNVILSQKNTDALSPEETRQALHELQESQTTLNTIINSTEDWIWSVDPERFGLLTFNDRLRRHFLERVGIQITKGMTPEDLYPTAEFVQAWHDLYSDRCGARMIGTQQ